MKKLLLILFISLFLPGFAHSQHQEVIAVLDFRNNGTPEYNYLQNGIADMLTTTFAASRKIRVVERAQLEKVVDELRLGLSGLIDERTAAEVGKISGAQYVVMGAYIHMGNALRIDMKVVETQTAMLVPGAAASARSKNMETLDETIDELAAKLLHKLTGESFRPAVTGDPSRKGRLDFVFEPGDFYAVVVAGKNISAPEGSLTASVTLDHGRHPVQVMRLRGLFRTETLYEGMVDIPGGYLVRARYRNDHIEIYETTALPATAIVEEVAEPVATLSDTHEHESEGIALTRETHQIRRLVDAASSTANLPVSLSFMSKKGLCDIYLNGEKVLDLGISPIDGMAKGELESLVPGEYRLKVQSFHDTWYDGRIRLNPGDRLNIIVEPDRFEVLGQSNPSPAHRQIRETSRLIFLSEEGLCDIYLDGEKRASIGVPSISGMGQARIDNLEPGTYLIRIEGFGKWHDGTLEVHPAEEIKIRVEPDDFQIIHRLRL